MKRFKVHFGNEWPFEWHKSYRYISIFHLYYSNDGEGVSFEIHVLNFWVRFMITHKQLTNS